MTDEATCHVRADGAVVHRTRILWHSDRYGETVVGRTCDCHLAYTANGRPSRELTPTRIGFRDSKAHLVREMVIFEQLLDSQETEVDA